MRLLQICFVGSIAYAASQDPDSAEPDGIMLDDQINDQSWMQVVEKQEEFGNEISYKAETEKLMSIIIHSLYTERDVFLRELVSNSADALEKVRLSAMKEPKKGWKASEEDLKILVLLNKADGTITISDTGVGMCKNELSENLGTVAKSGTNEFLAAAARGASASNLIGQFGVGFYSAFLVADKVTVKSKCINETHSNVWTAKEGGHKYKVLEIDDTKDRHKAPHGTSIVLRLKDDAQSYLDINRTTKIIQRFSQFVAFPLYLSEQRDDAVNVADLVWRHMNAHKPLWLQDRSQLNDTHYFEFYKALTKDKRDPVTYIHFRTEGDIEFTGLLYIPESVEAARYRDPHKKKSKVKLYVQRVLISDDLAGFLPNWMPFISGIIDSNDLPLKVDRETFSDKRIIQKIKTKTLSKIFEMLQAFSSRADKEVETFAKTKKPDEKMQLVHAHNTTYKDARQYHFFWQLFGNNLMIGCVHEADPKITEKVLPLGRFTSINSPDYAYSLDQYIKKMKPGQKTIFYMSADAPSYVLTSPLIEWFKKYDVDVLIFTGPYEGGCMNDVTYKGYQLKSIEKNYLTWEHLAFVHAGADPKNLTMTIDKLEHEHRVVEKYYEPLKNWTMEALENVRASEIMMSRRLINAPCIASVPSVGFTASHERMARTQMGQNLFMVDAMARMKTLELNPNHPAIYQLNAEMTDILNYADNINEEVQALIAKWKHVILVLYETALIGGGFQPGDPQLLLGDLYSSFTQRIVNKSDNKEAVAEFKLEIPKDFHDYVYQEEEEKKLKADAKNTPYDDDEDDDEDDLEWDDKDGFVDKDEL